MGFEMLLLAGKFSPTAISIWFVGNDDEDEDDAEDNHHNSIT